MIKISYMEKGSGFPLVLIHGLSDDLRFWEPLIPELSKIYRIIALDLRGHGKSEKPEGPYSIKQFSNDIYDLLLKLEIKKAHFVGFSMGGAILQQLALQNPEMIGSLVLISSFSCISPYLKDKLMILKKSLIVGGFGDFFDEMVPLVLTPEFIEEKRIELTEVKNMKIKTQSRDSLISSINACLEFNLEDSTDKIKGPVLIISGREDILTPINLAQKLYKNLKCSSWVIIEKTGHNILIPKNITQMLQLIILFLNDEFI